MRAKILMLGTSVSTQGGIASVLKILESRRDILSSDIHMLITHIDGTKLQKSVIAIKALSTYVALTLMGRIRLLHVHCASGASFWRKLLFIFIAISLRKPVVLHWHGGGLVNFFGRCSARQQRVVAWVFCRCSRVIALSDSWNRTISEMFPSARVVTIPNPVELPTQPATLVSFPLTALFLGRIVEEKGVFDLLKAWQEVHESFPSARLVLAGVGDLDAARNFAASLGIKSCVSLTGWVEGVPKLSLLHNSSLFVLPSHAEAMPMSVLEAMAWGLPVVATRVGGIPEAVRDGKDGLLFDVGDSRALSEALLLIFEDSRTRVAMGASARLRIKQDFSSEVVLPRIRQVWREVLTEHGDLESI